MNHQQQLQQQQLQQQHLQQQQQRAAAQQRQQQGQPPAAGQVRPHRPEEILRELVPSLNSDSSRDSRPQRVKYGPIDQRRFLESWCHPSTATAAGTAARSGSSTAP